jgi:hypothetical protein
MVVGRFAVRVFFVTHLPGFHSPQFARLLFFRHGVGLGSRTPGAVSRRPRALGIILKSLAQLEVPDSAGACLKSTPPVITFYLLAA